MTDKQTGMIARILAAGLGLASLLLMLFRGGSPPETLNLPAGHAHWLALLLFGLLTVFPFYILFRFSQRKANTRRDYLIYMGGAIGLAVYSAAFEAYRYSFGQNVIMLLLCLLLRLAAWGVETPARQIKFGITVGALFLSFAVNYALAPIIHMPRADDYFGPKMPRDVAEHLEYYYWIWGDTNRAAAAQAEMRSQNPEWDLISRTFLGYSLANVAMKYPDHKMRAMECLDKVIDDTAQVPWRRFLLPYGSERPFLREPASSIMVDGEIGLMIGLRRLIQDEPGYRWKALHRQLVKQCIDAIEAGPALCGESYPDECWLWCNPVALVSIKVWDLLEGEDHSDLFRRWEEMARTKLVDRNTGLFNSAVTLPGDVIYEPEGSTIWIGASCLMPVLPQLAEEQYKLMKKQLSGRLLFMAYGREWPRGKSGSWDIDSGFTPLGMGPASTGFALVASKEMGDKDFFARLLALVNIVGVPQTEHGRRRYLSSNLVGDATFLFAKTTGPAWAEIRRRDLARKEPKS